MTTVTQIQARRSPTELPRWCFATWADYIEWVPTEQADPFRIFFNRGRLFIDTGWEGINHARFRELLAMLFWVWFSRRVPGQAFDCLGGCIFRETQPAGSFSR